jgi:FixJ family two-component response regulator
MPVISVVDDDQAIRVALGGLIRSLGLQVRAYASAEAFLATGDAETTSCLICDIRMSGMSGVEMHERQRKQNKAPPTILPVPIRRLCCWQQTLPLARSRSLKSRGRVT